MDYLILIIAYILGSIPFGLIIAKIAGHGDIRNIGSGNIGATNVLRTGKKSLAVLTLILDMIKGTIAVLIAQHFAPEMSNYSALLVLLGHMFPIWLKFKGGKGVATAFGVMIALAYPVAIMAMMVWLASAVILRISSMSALISIGTMPIFIGIYRYNDLYGLVLVIIALIILKHNGNIIRLLKGTEPHIKTEKMIDEKEKA